MLGPTTTNAGSDVDAAMRSILEPRHLYSRAEVLGSQMRIIPPVPGIYGWYFDHPPSGVPVSGCHRLHDHTLLYVGISPREPKSVAARSSEGHLRKRISSHLRGNASSSTLRLSLGALLGKQTGIRLRRIGPTERFHFLHPDEQALDAWLAAHGRVVWTPAERPWDLERRLLATLPLPLNLKGNEHPFVPILSGLRDAARDDARALPVALDKGGPRCRR